MAVSAMYGSKDTVQVTNEDTVRHMGLEHRLGAYGLETCLTKRDVHKKYFTRI